MNTTAKWYDSLGEAPKDSKNIRKAVFIVEQGFKNEFDETDKIALHLVLYNENKAVATGRIFTEDDGKIYHIGRVATLKEYRGNGLGSVLMKEMLKKIIELNGTQAILSAQVSAKPFYEIFGFKCKGEEYLDEYCPHINMIKSLI